MQGNPFESGERKVIPAVLVYLRQEGQVLMIHRNSKAPGRVDYHEGKWNGLGGKLEKDESPLEAALREVEEESGLKLASDQIRSLGVLQFPNFKSHKNEDWVVFVFTGEVNPDQSQNLIRTSQEGDLHWIPIQDLSALNLWPGDRHFIPYVMKSKPFVGTIWYQGPEVSRFWIQPL